MKITSTAFGDNEPIPERYTCDGQDINPPLEFEDIPLDAANLALIVVDPDAVSKKPFYHWVLFNIDIGTKSIDEDSMPETADLGINDFGTMEYKGPCPPSGTHKYIYTLYALDGSISPMEDATAADILEEMEGHILDTAQLVGIYSKKIGV